MPEQDRGPGKEAVELYIRTYATLLRSSGETRLRVLEQSHIGMESSLHLKAGSPEPDPGALIYALRRLPPCITAVRRIVLGQSADVFWRTLQVDVDDIVPQLVALQIEWKKLHGLLAAEDLEQAKDVPGELALADRLGIQEEDWMRLLEIWGPDPLCHLRRVKEDEKNFSVRMLGGTQVGYAKATRRWWAPIASLLKEQGLEDRPVYFVSSNTHSLVNLLSGTARRRQNKIVEFIDASNNLELVPQLRKLRQGASR